MKTKLKRIELGGFKSFGHERQGIEFRDITVLIGANGSGKSNIVSFLKMLKSMMEGKLSLFVGMCGGAESLLHLGSKATNHIFASVFFTDNNISVDAPHEYSLFLQKSSLDTLVFLTENIYLHSRDDDKKMNEGGKESSLRYSDEKEHKDFIQLSKNIHIFHFQDTSATSGLKKSVYIEDAYSLMSDGGNLAAFLYAMKSNPESNKYFNRIERYIQTVFPQFKEFVLQPTALNDNYIILNYRERGSDYLFGAHQISDGTLRFMALATLLLQPPKTLPSIVILDEPELGLHPAAISTLAGMVKMAAQECQVVLATQSPILVDEFSADEVVVVERDRYKRCSITKKLSDENLSDWLEVYSLSELWDKNVIGGRP